MNKRTSAFARILAALALLAAVVVVVIVVSSGLKDDSAGNSHRRTGKTNTPAQRQHRTKAKTYVVQTGDTLTAISHQTGVPVSELLALNPEVDPQILIAGEALKLR